MDKEEFDMKLRHDVIRFPEGKTKAFTMSYDDGVVQDKRLIALMRSHGVKGTFNLNSGTFGQVDQYSHLRVKHEKIFDYSALMPYASFSLRMLKLERRRG